MTKADAIRKIKKLEAVALGGTGESRAAWELAFKLRVTFNVTEEDIRETETVQPHVEQTGPGANLGAMFAKHGIRPSKRATKLED